MAERRPTLEVHEAMPAVRSLVPGERDVVTGRLAELDRDDKGGRRHERDHDSPAGALATSPPGPAPARSRVPRWALVAGGSALTVVVIVGVGVATGPLGGGSDGSAAPPRQEALSGPGVADLPPALDPERIVAYEATLTRTAVEVAPGVQIPADEAVGSVDTSTWTCEAGACTAAGLAWICAADGCADDAWTFAAAVETYSHTGTAYDSAEYRDTPCFPVTVRLDLVRAEDGSYAGTLTQDPVQVSGRTDDGTTIRQCVVPRIADAVTLTPVPATS